jgi:DNA mismatch repair protein MutS2
VVKIRFLDEEQREQIGFKYILERLDVITPYGIYEKKNLKPFKKEEKLKLTQELDNMERVLNSIDIDLWSFKEIERIFYKLKDIRSSLKRCQNFDTLDDIELYEIKYFAILVEELISIYRKLNLNIENIKFSSLSNLISLLDPEGKKIPTFYIYNAYSEKLREIRKKKRSIENIIFKESDAEKVKKLKDERLDVIILEEEEELKIRKGLTQSIYDSISTLDNNIRSIGKLDFLIAKCNLAISLKGVRPDIADYMEIELIDGFNPEVLSILERSAKSFTPISISLKRGTTVITGANMGGKSITLKTIVLNLLLGQMGFFVFCKYARLPILDFMHFISDDMQSISKGLSTFGAEIIKLKEVVGYAKRGDGFIALDEFARGTNPKEGFYLVKSLCKYLTRFNSISLISTHYDGVVEDNMVHYQVIGLKNVNFDSLKYKIDLNQKHSVEIIQHHMNYKLERVSSSNKVPEDALNISILLGLEEDIIEIAKNYYEKEDNHGK